MLSAKKLKEITQKHGLYVQSCRLRAARLSTEQDVEIITPTRKPHIDKKLVAELQANAQEEQQVVVNCFIKMDYMLLPRIRIWPSTYLFSRDGKRLSRLVKSFNIGIYPTWSYVPPTGSEFTLIFESLPKDVESFDLIEVIPEPGEFAIRRIPRNGSDVYNLQIS